MGLLEQPAVLMGVLNAIPDMLRVLDKNHRVVLVNDSYQRSFGPQVGRQCYEMFCANGQCRNCVSRNAIETGAEQEKRRRYRGRTYWVKASPLHDGSEVTGTVEIFRDVTELVAREEALRIQNKRLLREANLAAQMQRALFLPKGPRKTGLRVESRYLPASSLGGDLFGCLERADGRACFYVADVSGHGIAAAMLTLMLANELKYAWETGEDTPVGLLNRARQAFLTAAADTQLYVTMFIGVIDAKSGRFSWVNAGHNGEPFLTGFGAPKRLYAPGLPICDWEPDVHYRVNEAVLEPGGRLFIYTDGLLDPRSSRLTQKELLRLLQRQEGSAKALLESLSRQVRGDRADDVCMLLIERPNEKGQ